MITSGGNCPAGVGHLLLQHWLYQWLRSNFVTALNKHFIVLHFTGGQDCHFTGCVLDICVRSYYSFYGIWSTMHDTHCWVVSLIQLQIMLLSKSLIMMILYFRHCYVFKHHHGGRKAWSLPPTNPPYTTVR